MWFANINEIAEKAKENKVSSYDMSIEILAADIIKMMKRTDSLLSKEMLLRAQSGKTNLKWIMHNRNKYINTKDLPRVNALLKEQLPPNVTVKVERMPFELFRSKNVAVTVDWSNKESQ